MTTTGNTAKADSIRFKTSDSRTHVTVNDRMMFTVRKIDVANPSARGGAYTTEWQAKRGGNTVIAGTRKAAAEAMIELLRSRGFTV